MKPAVLGLVLLALPGCEKSARQTFAEGVRIICEAPEAADVASAAPAERQQIISRWITARLKNEKARELFAAASNAPPAARGELLAMAADKAGLDRCMGQSLAELRDASAPLLDDGRGVLPAVKDAALVAADPKVTTVFVGPTSIVVEGVEVVPVRDWEIDPAHLEGGVLGVVIVQLGAFLRAVLDQADTRGVQLAIHREAPTELALKAILTAVRSSEAEDLHLLVAGDQGIAALPVHVPQRAGQDGLAADVHAPGGTSAEPPPPPSLKLVAALTRNELVLFSLDGSEGTLRQPRLELVRSAGAVPTLDWAGLRASLREIVDRRWSGGARPSDSQQIIVMADRTIPFGELAALIATVRGSAAGPPLFPEVLLSLGFE
ncbi:MAG TPA: hypothetical protein VML75_18565 [Kofleriaceae bacterium]|nr:hypothetical protein [Kofleriaceae bacterium]